MFCSLSVSLCTSKACFALLRRSAGTDSIRKFRRHRNLQSQLPSANENENESVVTRATPQHNHHWCDICWKGWNDADDLKSHRCYSFGRKLRGRTANVTQEIHRGDLNINPDTHTATPKISNPLTSTSIQTTSSSRRDDTPETRLRRMFCARRGFIRRCRC